MEECELHVVGSEHRYILLLVTGSGAAIGRDQVTFCLYMHGYETIGCCVE